MDCFRFIRNNFRLAICTFLISQKLGILKRHLAFCISFLLAPADILTDGLTLRLSK